MPAGVERKRAPLAPSIGEMTSFDDPRMVARDESGPGFDTRTSWYRFGTDHCVHKLLIVLQRGRGDAQGRVGTDVVGASAGWGPSGRRFKSCRPDSPEARFGSGFPPCRSLRLAV